MWPPAALADQTDQRPLSALQAAREGGAHSPLELLPPAHSPYVFLLVQNNCRKPLCFGGISRYISSYFMIFVYYFIIFAKVVKFNYDRLTLAEILKSFRALNTRIGIVSIPHWLYWQTCQWELSFRDTGNHSCDREMVRQSFSFFGRFWDRETVKSWNLKRKILSKIQVLQF